MTPFLYNYAATGNRAFLAITNANMITALRAAVTIIGSAELSYEAADVGIHSIRSGAAMALVFGTLCCYLLRRQIVTHVQRQLLKVLKE